MSTEENKKIIQHLFNEAINNQDLTVVDKYISADFVNHGMPDAQPGPDSFRQVITGFKDAFPDMHVNVEEITGDGDLIATRGSWEGTHNGSFMGIPPTGKTVHVQYMDFWKIENGKCIENWVQMDIAGLMQQLGVMPS
jgi:steroid delta-isomerase-like uncharacterized protein